MLLETSFQLNEQLAANDSHLPLYPSPIQNRGKASSLFAQQPFGTPSPIPVSPPLRVDGVAAPRIPHSVAKKSSQPQTAQSNDPVGELLQRGMRLREAMAKAANVTSISGLPTTSELNQTPIIDELKYHPIDSEAQLGNILKNQQQVSRPNVRPGAVPLPPPGELNGSKFDPTDSLELSASMSNDYSAPSALALVDDPNGVRVCYVEPKLL